MSSATAIPTRRAKHRAEGFCIRCGKAPAAPGGASCEPCLEKRCAADRARNAAAKAAGKFYGGTDVEASRRGSRARMLTSWLSRQVTIWQSIGVAPVPDTAWPAANSTMRGRGPGDGQPVPEFGSKETAR